MVERSLAAAGVAGEQVDNNIEETELIWITAVERLQLGSELTECIVRVVFERLHVAFCDDRLSGVLYLLQAFELRRNLRADRTDPIGETLAAAELALHDANDSVEVMWEVAATGIRDLVEDPFFRYQRAVSVLDKFIELAFSSFNCNLGCFNSLFNTDRAQESDLNEALVFKKFYTTVRQFFF